MNKEEARYRINRTWGTKNITEDLKLTVSIKDLIKLMTRTDIVEKLNIHTVSNQRELLINYNNWLDENVSLRYNELKTEYIDEFLKSD